MKSSEIKKILKPLIKQTIKEVLFEEGVLSGIVSEVAKGMRGDLVVESRDRRAEKEAAQRKKKEELYEKNRQERIRRLNESAKNQMGFDPYEGTAEMPEQTTGAPSALSGVGAQDSGVDISDIEKLSNGKWRRLIQR